MIPASKDEDPQWTQELVSSLLVDVEVAEVLVITEGDALSFPLSSNEKVRKRQQSDPRGNKASALNDGLAMSRSPYTIFIDSDVVLRGDEISITRQLLEEANFVGAGYGKRSSFPLLSPTSGWFFGCKTSVFRDAGGWKGDGHTNEDVVTVRGLQRQGYRVVDGGFTVELRRGVRNPLLKLASALFGR